MQHLSLPSETSAKTKVGWGHLWLRIGCLCGVAFSLLFGACQSSSFLSPQITSQSILHGVPDLSIKAVGALTVEKEGTQQAFCTGTLIASRLVLTAAHCVPGIVGEQRKEFRFRVDTPDGMGKFSSTFYGILEAHQHPRYASSSSERAGYDVAVLILEEAVVGVAPLNLSLQGLNSVVKGQTLRLSGYGFTQTQPEIVYADQKYSADIPLFQVIPRQLILWDEITKKSACHGDSGGPALLLEGDTWVVVGVTSQAYRATFHKDQRHTNCDGGVISTRVDANLPFLGRYWMAHHDPPRACLYDGTCTVCGQCEQFSCRPRTFERREGACLPCQREGDACGQGGRCFRREEGWRCLLPCSEATCYQCASGYQCKSIEGIGSSARFYCLPDQSTCAEVLCQSDAMCGPAERCVGGRCALQKPPRQARLCRPCTSSAMCDSGGFCADNHILGYCTQSCDAQQLCPVGFRCEAASAGLNQCVPTGVCDIACSPSLPCPEGMACRDGRCLRGGGGQDGDFCDASRPCAAAFACVPSVQDASLGRCILRCDPPRGQSGAACKAEQTCDGQRVCLQERAPTCFETCTNACPQGGLCEQILDQHHVCLCRSHGDCLKDQLCNFGRWGDVGVGICSPVSALSACPPGRYCRARPPYGMLCLGTQPGYQEIGSPCDDLQGCTERGICFRMTSLQKEARCFEQCTDQQCLSGGTCRNLGAGWDVCLCKNDAECLAGQRCEIVMERDEPLGLCISTLNTPCQRDLDCPREFRCKEGACLLDQGRLLESPPSDGKGTETPTIKETEGASSGDGGADKSLVGGGCSSFGGGEVEGLFLLLMLFSFVKGKRFPNEWDR